MQDRIHFRWAMIVAAATLIAMPAAAGTQSAAREGSHVSRSMATPSGKAVAELNDARLLLSRLDGWSTSRDAREALGPLRDEFHALYRSYTGLDLDKLADGQKAAAYVDSMVRPRGVWRNYYAEVDRRLTNALGSSNTSTKAVGTSGRTGAAMNGTKSTTGMAGIPSPARSDFEAIQMHLHAFYLAANAQSAAKG